MGNHMSLLNFDHRKLLINFLVLTSTQHIKNHEIQLSHNLSLLIYQIKHEADDEGVETEKKDFPRFCGVSIVSCISNVIYPNSLACGHFQIEWSYGIGVEIRLDRHTMDPESPYARGMYKILSKLNSLKKIEKGARGVIDSRQSTFLEGRYLLQVHLWLIRG